MDLFDHLLGAEGCNVDGTVGSNPFTSFVDNVFDSQFTSGMEGGQASAVFFAADPSNAENIGTMDYSMASAHVQGNQMVHSHNMYGHAANMPTMHPYPMAFMHPPPMQQFGYIPNQQYASEQYEQFEAYSDDEEYLDEQYAQQYNQDHVEYEQDLQHGAGMEALHPNMTTVNEAQEMGPSKEGYNQAWESLQSKLQSGELGGDAVSKNAYQFVSAQDNPNIVADQPLDINQMMENGMKNFREGRIKQAILCFESVVQDSAGAERDDAWRMLGACHAENDQDKEAIYCLNKALDCDPYNLDALLALGTSYVNELDSVKALETLRTWVAHNPRYQGLDTNTVDEYSDGTLMDEVMQLMVAVAAYDPSDTEVQVVLGVLYNVSLDYGSAIECFTKACAMRPDDYSLVNKLAASYANSNQSEQAVPYYSQALQLRPNFARGWLNLGISFANLDRHEDAAKSYIQALHLNPEAKHIWSYVRVVLSCMDRFDLVTTSATENIAQLASSLNVELINTDK